MPLRIDPAHMTDSEWTVVRNYFDAARQSGEVVELSSRVETLTPAQAAKRLGMSRTTITRRILDGEIRAFKTGAHYRIPVPEFERFRDSLMAQMITATSDELEAELYGEG